MRCSEWWVDDSPVIRFTGRKGPRPSCVRGIPLGENPKWNKYGYVEDVPAQELRILSRLGEKSYEIPTSDLEGASKGYFDSKAKLQQIITAIVRDQCMKT
jgi:hypothetical protein